MGEAKRRAAFAPAKGKTSYMQGRGILINHLVAEIDGGVTNRKLNVADFNSAILYWDQIACATNNALHVTLPSEDLLVKEGLLIRPRALFSGVLDGRFAGMMSNAQAQQFAALERERPGFWCAMEAEPEKLVGSPVFEAGRSALIKIAGAMPLPPDGTPVEDMLDFKRKRAAELARLRLALDELYLRVSANPDQAMALQVTLAEVDKAIGDLLKTSKEWWKLVKLTDVKTLTHLGAAGIGAAFAGTVMPAAGVLVGGVGAFFSISESIKAKRKNDAASPYWYAVSVQREWG